MPLVTAASASRDPAPHAVHRVRIFIWDGKLNMVWVNHNKSPLCFILTERDNKTNLSFPLLSCCASLLN